MNTAPLLFLALCVDALVKLSLLVRYEELHLLRSAVHIRTGNVRHLRTGRKLAPKRSYDEDNYDDDDDYDDPRDGSKK